MRMISALCVSTTLLCFCISSRAGEEQSPLFLGTRPAELMFQKIAVSQMRASYDFYTKLLGLKEVESAGPAKISIDNPNADTTFAEVCLNFSGSAADPLLCLIKAKDVNPDPEYTKLTWVGVKTPDIHAMLERLRSAGYHPPDQPDNFRGVLVSVVSDPDGYSVEIVQAKSAPIARHGSGASRGIR
jgi:catechol 2,3-dioxygenase-like lactoylglutathione lyase family enzyme